MGTQKCFFAPSLQIEFTATGWWYSRLSVSVYLFGIVLQQRRLISFGQQMLDAVQFSATL